MKNIKIVSVFLLVSCAFFSFSCGSARPLKGGDKAEAAEPDEDEIPIKLPDEWAALPVSSFREIWAYVYAERESALRPGMPLSDIGYFGAEISTFGALVDVPSRRNLPAFNGRVHLVVACNGGALSHFVLYPGRPERKALISDLISATKNFDGLQIDFENVPQRDAAAFLSFLAELRAGLGDKMFTVALRARTRKIDNDQYDYEKIKPLVDRILVMAYDEHWSGSSPGSIASLGWCRRVADYSLKAIGPDKLIMGIPFYGRAWGSPGHSSAYIYSSIERVIRENNVKEIRRENGIPTFDYTATISVKAYFEDAYSLSARMEMYKSQGVSAIGFWRLGQETPAVWNLIQIEH